MPKMDNFTIPNIIVLNAMQNKKIHDYKGFTIEPVLGGFMIVAYCRNHIFCFAGPRGFDLSTDIKEAKIFRTCSYCYGVIDELITDHAGWVKTLSEKKIKQKNECV